MLIADDGLVAEVAPLCLRYKLGIEVQAFFKPEYFEKILTALADHERIISPIELRSMHGPFCDLNPGSTDPLITEVTRKRMDQGWSFATSLNIQHIIFHNGYIPGFSPEKKWFPRAVKFWQEFLEAHPEPIEIHIENTLERSPTLMKDLIDAINSPRLTINLDIGHTHCFSKFGTVNWIKTLGPRIGYSHLHDNHGERDEHLGLTVGTIPIRDICYALEEYAPNACWTIEADFDGIETSLKWLDREGFLPKYN